MTSHHFEDFFPNPIHLKSDLVAVGGDLSLERLIYAYSHGIFPWTDNPIRWYSLDPRAIFDLNRLILSKRVMRKIKQKKFRITFDQCFEEVIRNCATNRPKEETWITENFINAYVKLHQVGFAHSVESWDETGKLAGGVYGVAIRKFFAGESMFSISADAGKIALFHLFEKLKKEKYLLFDTQHLNQVTYDLGAFEISKSEYLDRLFKAIR